VSKQRGPSPEVIDEFGELSRRIAEMKPVADRVSALKRKILSYYSSLPNDQPAIAEGSRYTVQISPRAVVRSISSMSQVFKLLGVRRFLAACRFPLSEFDRLIGDKSLLREERTGERTLRAVPKS